MMLDNLIYDPVIPIGFIAIGAAVVALLTIFNYGRALPNAGRIKRAFLGLLRLGVIAGVSFLLLRPMIDLSAPAAKQKPVFLVLMETSRSMNKTDVAGASRIQSAVNALKKHDTLLGAGTDKAGVEMYTFGESLKLASGGVKFSEDMATSKATDIAQALNGVAQAAEGRNVTGVLLISDGHDTAGGAVPTAATYLKSMNIPVYTTTFGSDAQTKDVSVSARLAQNFIFRNQRGTLTVNLSQSGYPGWYTRVQLFRGDELVKTEQVRLGAAVHQIQFPIVEKERGLVRYTVKAEPLAGEADRTNNERTIYAQVVDEKAKVLLIEGEPYWDSKFLLRSLQADPDLDVTAIFAMSARGNKVFAVTQGHEGNHASVHMPTTKEDLYQYDCVFLGRGTEHVFSAAQMQLFKQYLEERGGGLIFARGKSYGAQNGGLAELEPVVWGDGALAKARFELTAAGKTNPIFSFGDAAPEVVLRELPEMISIARVKEEKSLAIVLAKAHGEGAPDELATIAYQRYGKGRVMTVGSAGLWRWAFMRQELAQYDRIYARFWGQMIRWIVYGSDFLPGQDISFRIDRVSYQPDEVVTLALQTKLVDAKAYHPKIVVKQPGGEPMELEPEMQGDNSGVYTTAFVPKREGEYEAVLNNNVGNPKTDSVRFVVYADAIETRQVAANPDRMREIATSTGGRVVTPDDWDGLPREARVAKSEETRAPKPVDAWDKIEIFGVLVGLLALEWFVRRRSGLL